MTGLLLDTHVLLWANATPDRLGQLTTARLLDPANELYVSAVSAAEIAIKRSIGRLELAVPIAALLEPIAASELALSTAHAEAIERLPLLHRDPFDRLLTAQAITEELVLVTADERILAYPVDALDART